MEEKKGKEERNETAQQGRFRLLSDKDFLECWTLLLSSPAWIDKGPRARLMHLDKLAKYPTAFAVYLVAGAVSMGLSYAVPDNAVEVIFERWQYWQEKGRTSLDNNGALVVVSFWNDKYLNPEEKRPEIQK